MLSVTIICTALLAQHDNQKPKSPRRAEPAPRTTEPAADPRWNQYSDAELAGMIEKISRDVNGWKAVIAKVRQDLSDGVYDDDPNKKAHMESLVKQLDEKNRISDRGILAAGLELCRRAEARKKTAVKPDAKPMPITKDEIKGAAETPELVRIVGAGPKVMAAFRMMPSKKTVFVSAGANVGAFKIDAIDAKLGIVAATGFGGKKTTFKISDDAKATH